MAEAIRASKRAFSQPTHLYPLGAQTVNGVYDESELDHHSLATAQGSYFPKH